MIRFLRIYLPVAAVLIAVCYSYYYISNRDMLQHAQLEDIAMAQLEQQLLAAEFRSFASDLITFANMQEWRHAFEPSNTTAMRDLEEEFQTLLAMKKDYEKVRLIGMDGKEMLRVEFLQSRVRIVPNHELQNKKQRYYLAASSALHQNQIYVSPMDLNWENGNVVQPLQPSMRLITPVFDAAGQQRGLLVLNVRVEEMLQEFMDMHAGFPKRSFLLDQEGNWLHDGIMAKNWEFLRPDYQQTQFRETFPEAWQRIHQHENGHVVNEQGMFTFRTFHVTQAASRAVPDQLRYGELSPLNNQQLVWKIVEHRSAAELVALTEPLKQRIGVYTLIFLLLLAMLSWRMVVMISTREKAEQRLRESEQKFRYLVENLPDGVVVIINATLVYANRMASAIFSGENARTIVGKAVMDFVHLESRQAVSDRLKSVMNGEPVSTAEVHLLSADGTDVFAQVTSMATHFEGKPAIQTTIKNMTEQREAEGALRISQQRYELYRAQTSLAVIEWNTDFTVSEWNPGAEIIFGFSADNAKGKHATELILPPEQRAAVDVIWQQLLVNQGGYHSINENVTQDGRTITCE